MKNIVLTSNVINLKDLAYLFYKVLNSEIPFEHFETSGQLYSYFEVRPDLYIIESVFDEISFIKASSPREALKKYINLSFCVE